jgi:hypothetical protein
MNKNKALRYLALSLITLTLLSLVIWIANFYTLPFLSAKINQDLLLFTTILLGVSALLASLNDISDIFNKIFDNKEENILKITVEKAAIKYIERGRYWIQINMVLHAKNKDIYLKTIMLKKLKGLSFSENTLFGKDGLKIASLIPYLEKDALSLSSDQFYENIKIMEPESIQVRDLCIKCGSFLSLTLVGDFYSELLNDGWDDFPLNQWLFVIEYGENHKADCQFSFSVHPSSPQYPIKFEHDGFKH